MQKQLAQLLNIPWNDANTTIAGPLPADIKLGDILSKGVKFVFVFAGVGLFLMLVAGGFDFLTSAGDSKKMEQGKQRLTYAIVGFLIIFASFWIVQIFGIIFGLESIKTIFG